jgi:flavin-binding protein dodecin
LIAPHGNKRYVRRDERGRIKESDDVSRALAGPAPEGQERRQAGQGDCGDRERTRQRERQGSASADGRHCKEETMAESVYKVIELVGTSTQSWEQAAKVAVERAAKTLRDLRVAEVVEQDLMIEDGKVGAYRTKLKVSFKFEGS